MCDYIIQPGDNFYRLAKRFGGTCDDWLLANPGINPLMLQIGQKVVLPEIANPKVREQFAEVSVDRGHEFAGDHMDDVEMEIEGVRFRLKRIGESKVPHEIHLIVPRTEIRKIQPHGEHGPCEIQIMLSNVNIVHSPRLMSEGGGTKISVGTQAGAQTGTQTGMQAGGTAGAGPHAGTDSQSGMSFPPPGGGFSTQNQTGETGQTMQTPLARIEKLRQDIRPDRSHLFHR